MTHRRTTCCRWLVCVIAMTCVAACTAPPPLKPTMSMPDAVRRDDVEQVRRHLWHHQRDQGEGRIDYAHTILPLAASYGHDRIVTLLLDEGVAIVPRQRQAPTALHYAAARGHISTIALLLERGAPVDRPDENGKTPLIWAAETGQADCVRRLLDAGADPNHRGKYGTALDATVKNKYEDVIILLRDHQSNTTASP